MSDETIDAVALCRATVRDVIHLVRLNLLRGHERRTLLDALDAVPREAVEQEAERCAREIDAVSQVQDMAVNAWRRRAERAEAERDRYREALEDIRDGRPWLSYEPGVAMAMDATRYGWSLAGDIARQALEREPS